MQAPEFKITRRTVISVIVLQIVLAGVVNIVSNHADTAVSPHLGVLGRSLGAVLGWSWAPTVAALLPGIIGVLALYRWSLGTGIPKPKAPDWRSRAPKGIIDYKNDLEKGRKDIQRVLATVGRAMRTMSKRSEYHAPRVKKYENNLIRLTREADWVARDYNGIAQTLERAYSPLVEASDLVFTSMDGLLRLNGGDETSTAAALATVISMQGTAKTAATSMQDTKGAIRVLTDIQMKQSVSSACMRLEDAADGIVDVINDIDQRCDRLLSDHAIPSRSVADTSAVQP